MGAKHQKTPVPDLGSVEMPSSLEQTMLLRGILFGIAKMASLTPESLMLGGNSV